MERLLLLLRVGEIEQGDWNPMVNVPNFKTMVVPRHAGEKLRLNVGSDNIDGSP